MVKSTLNIFLDIDGVINIIGWVYSTQFNTTCVSEPHLMAYLNYIIKETKANIIISSSRRDDMTKLKNELKEEGFQFCENITGCTPLNNKKRGEQIQEYIKDNDIVRYLVIDDEVSGINGIDGKFIPAENIVKVDPTLGLTLKDIANITSSKR